MTLYPHPIYPTADLIVVELRRSMRAARRVALNSTRNRPNRQHLLSEYELANLTASLERIIALLEVEK